MLCESRDISRDFSRRQFELLGTCNCPETFFNEESGRETTGSEPLSTARDPVVAKGAWRVRVLGGDETAAFQVNVAQKMYVPQ